MMKKIISVFFLMICLMLLLCGCSVQTCSNCGKIIFGESVKEFGNVYCTFEHFETDTVSFEDKKFEEFLCEMFEKESGTITGADLLSVRYFDYYEGTPTCVSVLANRGKYEELFENSILFSTEDYPDGVVGWDVLYSDDPSDVALKYRNGCTVVTVRSNEWMAEHVMPYLYYFKNLEVITFGYCWVSDNLCLPENAHPYYMNDHARDFHDPYDPIYQQSSGANDLIVENDTPIAQQPIDEQKTTSGITVDDMRDSFPYVLFGDTIKEFDCVGPYYELCYFINYEDFKRIPRLLSNEQLIIKTERNDFDYVVLEPIEISYDDFVSPYIRFYYNYDGELLLYSDGREIQGNYLDGNYEVEDTNLPLWYIDNSLMNTDSYYLHSNDSPDEYTVGYWEGTQYSEITLETKYMPFTKSSSIECYFTRTHNGYSIIDLADLESGYYIIRGLSYKKGDNGSHGYLIYIE